MDWTGSIEFCPEWIHIPDSYKILLGFKWADKRGGRVYMYIPPNWQEEWGKFKLVLEKKK
jgi:hypothetical protein